MNPSSGESIPTPQFEAPAPAEAAEQRHDKNMEKSAPTESAAGKHQPQALNVPVLALPTDIPAAAPVAIPDDTTQGDESNVSQSQQADRDSHRIESQWVERAKKVIAKTKDDPHSQKEEMSQVKAEYIRKRFNKTIPTDNKPA